MNKILSADECAKCLFAYYLEHYGQRNDDTWHECSAVNVKCFSRDGKYIYLKCHILTGKIEVIEE